jgi:hypothetical protein
MGRRLESPLVLLTKSLMSSIIAPRIGTTRSLSSPLLHCHLIAHISTTLSPQVTFSSLEIYNESIRDLLDNSGTKDKLDVRQTPEGNSVPGLTEIPVLSSTFFE